MDIEITDNQKNAWFTLNNYFKTLAKIIKRPSGFFSEMDADINIIRPLAFLFISSSFHTLASLSNMNENHMLLCGISFINAMMMTVITSSIGFLCMIIIMGKRTGFSNFLAIYAFANGVTLLISWLPSLLLFSEPWKWWLIYKGMVKGLGFTSAQSIFLIGVSICLVILVIILMNSGLFLIFNNAG